MPSGRRQLRIGSWIGHFGLLVPLAVLGVIVTWPDRRRLWILYALTLTYALSVVMFYVFARYRYPLVPFLLLFAAARLRLTITRSVVARLLAQGMRVGASCDRRSSRLSRMSRCCRRR